MTLLPRSAPGMEGGAACLEYKVWLQTQGDWQAVVRTLPTWATSAGHPDSYKIALDDETPSVVFLPNYTGEFDPQWQQDVLRDAALTHSLHHVVSPGLHTLKIWLTAPGIVLDAVMLDCDSSADPGFAWQDETRTVQPPHDLSHSGIGNGGN